MLGEMKTTATQILTQTATHPKTAWVTIFIVNAAEWYAAWVSPVIITLTSTLSFIVMIILVRYHWLNTDKLKLDIEAQIAENKRIKELEGQIKGMTKRKIERD